VTRIGDRRRPGVRPAVRILFAVLLGVLALAALLAFLAFLVVLISVRDPGERGAAVALMVACFAVLAAAGWGLRRLLRRAR
jgi:uncharacterized membrane protein YqjE